MRWVRGNVPVSRGDVLARREVARSSLCSDEEVLDLHCPMQEHEPHVAIEHLKCDYCA